METVPALIAITVISSLVWGPLFVPVPFAIAVLSFHAYWLWRAHMTGIHAFKGFLLLRRHKKIDWRERYDKPVAGGAAAPRVGGGRPLSVLSELNPDADKDRPHLWL